MRVALYRKDMTLFGYQEGKGFSENEEDIEYESAMPYEYYIFIPSDFYIKTPEGFIRVYIEK